MLFRDEPALDCTGSLPLGVLLLSADRKLLHLNQRAKTILESPTVVGIEGDELVFARQSDSNAFRKLFHEALKSPTTCAMGLKRDDSPPLTLLISSSYRDQNAESDPVMVFIGDSALKFTASTGALRKFFDLTSAEARLAVLLLQGSTLKQASDTMRITSHTARVHLKNVFRKTETNRQSQLIYVLLSSPASAHLTQGNVPRRASAGFK